MPNPEPCLDTAERIRKYRGKKSRIPFGVVGAITEGREGRKLVDIERISPFVIGFSDDGNCLKDLVLLKDMLETYNWTMLHSGEDSPSGVWPRHTSEPEWVEKYLDLNKGHNNRLYIQHVSRKKSVELIRQAKKDGIFVVAETCPHYFKWTRDTMRVPVNPPIGDKRDREAIREGLSDGTIDIISSDYAPEPRPKSTGIADWENHTGSCLQLVGDGVIKENQLISTIYKKPLEIIKSTHAYRSGNINLSGLE
jgi:dihydroorotase